MPLNLLISFSFLFYGRALDILYSLNSSTRICIVLLRLHLKIIQHMHDTEAHLLMRGQ